MAIKSSQFATVGGVDDSMSRLLYLTQHGLWSELEKESVSFKFDGSTISVFSDDVWNFAPYKVGTETNLLNFRFPEGNVPPRLIQELKAVALAYVYHSRYAYRISSIRSKIDRLKRLVISLHQVGIFSFDGLTIEELKSVTKKGLYSPRELDLGPINSLNDLADFLPFKVNFSERLTLKKLRAKQLPKEQHPVIPLRLYLSALCSFTDEIRYWHQYKAQLEQVVNTAFEYERYQVSRMLKLLRHGKCGTSQVFNNVDKKYIKFISELEKHNVPLVDYENSVQWDILWNKCDPRVRTDFYEPLPVKKIGNTLFSSHNEIKDFCRKLDTRCRYLILCLSGMRSNELLQITPELGAQVITLDGIDIHLFHTKQQKITHGYQGDNDVYVTTRTGHLAYELLNALNRPVRNWHKNQGQKGWFLNSYTHFRKPRSVQRSGHVLMSLTKLFSTQTLGFSVELNSDDIEMLRRSDPEKTFNIGDRWHLTPHQLRRSLAYYLVGMQLADDVSTLFRTHG